MNIKEFNSRKANKVLVKWEKVGNELGYKLCCDVKDFFQDLLEEV